MKIVKKSKSGTSECWKVETSAMTGLCWVTGISVTQSGAFRWDWSEPCMGLGEAIEKIEQARTIRGDIASAWVKDDKGEMLFHGVYISLFGELDKSRV